MSSSALPLQSDMAASLLKAVLGPGCTEERADAVLAAAAASGVDPLDFCERRLGIPAKLTLSRGAAWAGLHFAPAIPHDIPADRHLEHIDALSAKRSLTVGEGESSVAYFAPSFANLLYFRDYLQVVPGLRQRLCVVPASALHETLILANQDVLLEAARERLHKRWPHANADVQLGVLARWGFVIGLLILTSVVAATPFWLKPVALPIVALVLVVPALFRLFAALRPAPQPAEPPALEDRDLPTYSVLLPLRDEAGMVPMLYDSMCALDYPPEKLDIKFVVEEESAETIEAVLALGADSRFELVVVPAALPGTKPKALNFALPLARGALLVVYDAEDIPEPDQLRRAAARMANDPEVHCLQAELVIDNAGENPLTAMFSGEYAGQFGLALPLLAHWNLPVPLGGTSNHFRTATLREIGGWDAYNVTEDADLGVRLARQRYRTETLSSCTYEEAPISLSAWMSQRTRWIKGWMRPSSHQNIRIIPWG